MTSRIELDAQVIGLRSLRRVDFDTVASSVAKTNRAVCVEGGGAPLLAITVARLRAEIRWKWTSIPMGCARAARHPGCKAPGEPRPGPFPPVGVPAAVAPAPGGLTVPAARLRCARAAPAGGQCIRSTPARLRGPSTASVRAAMSAMPSIAPVPSSRMGTPEATPAAGATPAPSATP